jgi:hypothetical protein
LAKTITAAKATASTVTIIYFPDGTSGGGGISVASCNGLNLGALTLGTKFVAGMMVHFISPLFLWQSDINCSGFNLFLWTIDCQDTF